MISSPPGIAILPSSHHHQTHNQLLKSADGRLVLKSLLLAAGLQLKRNGKPMTLWNRDCTDYPDLNLYGSHPFLMEVRPGQHLMWPMALSKMCRSSSTMASAPFSPMLKV